MAWSTSELATLAGTTVNTIRHYHRLGRSRVGSGSGSGSGSVDGDGSCAGERAELVGLDVRAERGRPAPSRAPAARPPITTGSNPSASTRAAAPAPPCRAGVGASCQHRGP